MEQRTHYADDATLAYIAKLERELAEAKAERDENGRLADNAQDGWRKSLEERQKLAAYAEELAQALYSILEGMEASGGWEGDDELFDQGMATFRRYEKREGPRSLPTVRALACDKHCQRAVEILGEALRPEGEGRK